MLLTKGPQGPQRPQDPNNAQQNDPTNINSNPFVANANRPQIKRSSPLHTLLAIVFGVMLGVVLFGGWFWLTATDEQKRELLNGAFDAPSVVASSITGLQTPKTVLVMGVDLGQGRLHDSFEGVRSDTMILLRLDPPSKKMNVISIPRDSRVELAGRRGIEKINAAFALGGPELAVKTVEQNFGVHIDDYLVINTQGVRDVVNALGGIDLYVDKPMHYKDYSAKLFIELEPGQHHLTGEEAEGYVRYRHDALGDIGRIRRQQIFAGAVLHKLKDPTALLALPNVLEVSKKYLLTNMSNPDLVSIAAFAKNVPFNEVNLATLPGSSGMSGGGSYWFVNADMATQVLKRLMTGYVPAPSTTETSSSTKLPSVGILYTTKHKADMQQLDALLTKEGYRVVCKTRNIAHPTQVIVHNMAQSNASADKLRALSPLISDSQLIFSPHGSTFDTNSCASTDYTLILGDNTRALTSNDLPQTKTSH